MSILNLVANAHTEWVHKMHNLSMIGWHLFVCVSCASVSCVFVALARRTLFISCKK